MLFSSPYSKRNHQLLHKHANCVNTRPVKATFKLVHLQALIFMLRFHAWTARWLYLLTLCYIYLVMMHYIATSCSLLISKFLVRKLAYLGKQHSVKNRHDVHVQVVDRLAQYCTMCIVRCAWFLPESMRPQHHSLVKLSCLDSLYCLMHSKMMHHARKYLDPPTVVFSLMCDWAESSLFGTLLDWAIWRVFIGM